MKRATSTMSNIQGKYKLTVTPKFITNTEITYDY